MNKHTNSELKVVSMVTSHIIVERQAISSARLSVRNSQLIQISLNCKTVFYKGQNTVWLRGHNYDVNFYVGCQNKSGNWNHSVERLMHVFKKPYGINELMSMRLSELVQSTSSLCS